MPLPFHMFDHLPAIVWSSDRFGTHDYVNAASRSFVGHSLTDAAHMWEELIIESDRARTMAVWEHSLRTGSPYAIDYRFKHFAGTHRWLRVQAHPMRSTDGSIDRWWGTAIDVNDLVIAVQRAQSYGDLMRRRAEIDGLTNTLNREAFMDAAVLSGRRASSTETQSMNVILIIDIDGFKSINDSYGHLVGDDVIREVAVRLSAAIPRHAILGRFGGDEFVVLIPSAHPDEERGVAQRILEAMRPCIAPLRNVDLGVTASWWPINFASSSGRVSVSVGGCTAPSTIELSMVIGVADRALYWAKSAGKDCHRSLAFP